MAEDRFKKYLTDLTSPGEYSYIIEPRNDEDLPIPTRAFYVGGAGNINCVLTGKLSSNVQHNSANSIFVGVVAGTFIPVRSQKVWAEGTTATFLLGIY